jgi:hypothetical protein
MNGGQKKKYFILSVISILRPYFGVLVVLKRNPSLSTQRSAREPSATSFVRLVALGDSRVRWIYLS